ncbi:class I SAM-dependent DNA methyltransferase [Corynebacterium neomassiliense]|uniref:class I SAM-dependent DNA methyltransferase n=1 Tax=Corynebacterium neomassiliense TaxID=2079482 RepID=UPI00102FDD7F|nr:class I SAM-dependent DNA methyltransferase [Corynebacterium neomassiliense]
MFDSIVNVEEWISDHYLTTEESRGASFAKRTADRIKTWKKDAESDGSESPWARLQHHREAVQTALAGVDAGDPATLAAANRIIRNAFGYGPAEELTVERNGQEIVFPGWSGNAGSVTVVDTTAVSSVEDLPAAQPVRNGVPGDAVTVDGKPAVMTAAKLVGDLFLSDTPPAFVLLVSGPYVTLAERESWPLGRYLTVDLGLAVERNNQKSKGELQQVTAILAREDTERAADGTTWWTSTIEESREHAVKVSAELRAAVRESIEIIGNDVVSRYRGNPELAGLVADLDGEQLGVQALRYLYRILFLLFAEASPEMDVLPVGTPEYDEGYGLSRIRELILTPPATAKAENGTHLYESLQLLFQLVDEGHLTEADAPGDADEVTNTVAGLNFRNLRADLFLPEKTAYIDASKLSNLALHRVLERLLLSPEQKGHDRGFISYATLGVTELGQVYEGLMSFKGFIAQTDLWEVAPHGKPEKGSWVVPESGTHHLPEDSFVLVDEEVSAAEGGGVRRVRRRHKRGSFVFRQSSRDRERSASFYTPQVLTEFTVGQALEELKAGGRLEKAADIFTLTICEPAMGSGAFAVEAVRQLAELYLTMREDELGRQVPSEDRAKELQRVKAYIALHQVYGVDLNRTAVELGEIALWLDIMTGDLTAPWFGLHLRRGNSLIGASRGTYSPEQLADRSWLTTPHRPGGVDEGRIFHFLVPGESWGAAADSKDLKALSEETAARQKELKTWRKGTHRKITKKQVALLQRLSVRAERLWDLAGRRIAIAEDQIRRDVNVWEFQAPPVEKNVSREQIEAELFGNYDGAYQRLRLVMDAWCALWFWPVTGEIDPPTMEEWLATLTDLFGTPVDENVGKTSKRLRDAGKGQFVLDAGSLWDDLNTEENLDWTMSGARSVQRCIEDHPWLSTVREIADAQGFFHWELDFAKVFAAGGFDLQVGNPPWVRPRTDVDALLSEADPWFSLANKPTQAAKRERTALVLNVQTQQGRRAQAAVAAGLTETLATAAFLGSVAEFPHLRNQAPDLYRAFIEQCWRHNSTAGFIGLIHPESHFTEKKAAPLRSAAYLRLRRHWQFVNELSLFDVHHLVSYGVHIYCSKRGEVNFINSSSCYHPKTILDSFFHDGTGPLPGLKDESGKWDRRPHKSRITKVGYDRLESWHSILEDEDTPILDTRMVYTVNSNAMQILTQLATAPRMKDLQLQFSRGWDESIDKKKGHFDSFWSRPTAWDEVILQGPHLGVSTPMAKEPNPTLKNNQDWSSVDFTKISGSYIPATSYKLADSGSGSTSKEYGSWVRNGKEYPIMGQYRIAYREMAATTGFRTLYPAIIPPGAMHVHTVNSLWTPDLLELSAIGATLSSIISDFWVRSSGSAHIFNDIIAKIPRIQSGLRGQIARIYLRLNCLTEEYADIWESVTSERWTMDTPLRGVEERRRAQDEIDEIAADAFGFSTDDLGDIYRTQFPVMRARDQREGYAPIYLNR